MPNASLVDLFSNCGFGYMMSNKLNVLFYKNANDNH